MSAAESLDLGRYCLDLAYQYAEDVRDKSIPTCRLTQLAIERWYRDLETGGERGLYFDENAAARVFRFFGYCRHYQGPLAGQPIIPEPWQCFVLSNVFGWMREDGTRRFRMAYEEVARKNGKTTKLGPVGLYGQIADNESGAKVYSAATKRDQAKELFNTARAMVLQNTKLRKLVDARQGVLLGRKNFSEFMPLSADHKSMDGLNVHMGLIDEYHAHPTSAVLDVIKSARGARLQALIWVITTAGFNRNGPCYQLRDYAIKVLEGSIEDDSFFAIIYTIDEGDDWRDPDVWRKANPNFGVSVNADDMADQCRMAQEMPSELTEFLTKRLNIWVYGESKWMNMERWNACRLDSFNELACWDPDQESDLDGMECSGGLDLASVEDLAAFSLKFEMPDGNHRFICRAYLPQAAMERRLQAGDKLYESFRLQGFLTVTPGEVTDYDYIKADILAACERFDVQAIGFDRFNSSQLVNDLLAEEVPMVAFGQGTASMNAPMKELMRLVLSGRVEHNNSVLSFAMSNMVADQNSAGDIRPAKNKVSEKIDPAVASIMALGLAMPAEEDDGSDQTFVEL